MTRAPNDNANRRAAWLNEIELAVGQKIGDEKSRRAFAEKILAQLPYTYPQAVQAQAIRNNVSNLHGAAMAARDATRALQKAIKQGNVIAWQMHSRAERVAQLKREIFNRKLIDKQAAEYDEAPWTADLPAFKAYLIELVKRCQRANDEMPSAKRGPSDITAVVITKIIAMEYRKHFNRKPSRAKAGGTGLSGPPPFDRVCDVVVRILESCGRPAHLTEGARAKGIAQAERVRSTR